MKKYLLDTRKYKPDVSGQWSERKKLDKSPETAMFRPNPNAGYQPDISRLSRPCIHLKSCVFTPCRFSYGPVFSHDMFFKRTARDSFDELWSEWKICESEESFAFYFLFLRRKFKIDPTESRRSMAKLRGAAEQCKHVLSTMNTAHCFVESLVDGVDLSSNVSRARFEALIAPLLPDFLDPLTRALDTCGLTARDVNKVSPWQAIYTCLCFFRETFAHATFPESGEGKTSTNTREDSRGGSRRGYVVFLYSFFTAVWWLDRICVSEAVASNSGTRPSLESRAGIRPRSKTPLEGYSVFLPNEGSMCGDRRRTSSGAAFERVLGKGWAGSPW